METSKAILKSGVDDPNRLLRVIKDELSNNNFDVNFMMRDTKIRIKYNVIEETHDGYCSDGYDFITTAKTITKTYPLLKFFTDDDIINQGGIRFICQDNPKLKYYEIDDTPHGNGYCGSKTSYNMMSNKVLNILT